MSELDPVDLVRALNEQSDLRPRKRTVVGGVAHVGPTDTIAGDGCWCGRPDEHDWLGKSEGAPHPRYPE